jgi:hypothetical protein
MMQVIAGLCLHMGMYYSPCICYTQLLNLKFLAGEADFSVLTMRKRRKFLSMVGTLTDKMLLCYCDRNSCAFITECKTKNTYFSVTKTTTFVLRLRYHCCLLLSQKLRKLLLPESIIKLKRMNMVHCIFLHTIPISILSKWYVETSDTEKWKNCCFSLRKLEEEYWQQCGLMAEAIDSIIIHLG